MLYTLICTLKLNMNFLVYLRFKSLRFLLINTKVPRNTKALVAGVGVKKQNVSESEIEDFFEAMQSSMLMNQEPELVNGILDSIQAISDEARRILADPELPRDQQVEGIGVRYISVKSSSHTFIDLRNFVRN